MAIITSPLIPLLIKEREYFRDEVFPPRLIKEGIFSG
jgi:hypothetical protein